LCLRMSVGETHSELFVDFSGESLQRRGYRLDGGLAPLRETLAAAMLIAAGWPDGDAPVLLDPFCGSGTLLVEAAGMLLQHAPGLLRDEYGLLHWPGTDLALWRQLREEARAARREPPPGLSLKGFDADASVL